MRNFYILIACVILSAGCARVRIEAPKEPIKVDISMRLDVYQHVQKDIDAIEGLVSGAAAKPAAGDKQSRLGIFLTSVAHAAEDLSPEVEQAALRRRDRYDALTGLEQKGAIGENRSGLVELRAGGASDTSTEDIIKAENSDRMIIYNAIAQKNGISLGETQKVYAERLQKDAPPGTPIETDTGSGSYQWCPK